VQNFRDGVDDGELYMGMSTREILYKFKWRTLMLFKALFLEKRVFSKCTRLTVDIILWNQDGVTVHDAVFLIITNTTITFLPR
jgi:hypothetical protein